MLNFTTNFFNKNLGTSQRYTGFTLAEILISLGIIGVVAVIIIPTINKNINEQHLKTAYVKAFSDASQAWQQALVEENIVPGAFWEDPVAKITNFNAFKSYFKVTKDCNNNNNSECWANGEKYFTCTDPTALAFIDLQGRSWSLCTNDSLTGPDILIDTNGFKAPNKYGQDRFDFQPRKNFTTLMPPPDCLSTTDCMDGLYSYTIVCPSVQTHPCYYKSWIQGK